MKIHAGVFLENKKQFAFFNDGGVYILNDYMNLVKICYNLLGFQMLKSTCSNYCVIKYMNTTLTMINTQTKEFEVAKRLRFLKQELVKYSKKTLIFSCLGFYDYLTH